MNKINILKYDEVLAQIGRGRCHLLLGNGFSIDCNQLFKYDNLFRYAKEQGLSKRVCGVFEYIGTNNFEGVMRLLEDTNWMANYYGLLGESKLNKTAFLEDLENVKTSLVEAIAKTHPPATNDISDESKDQCAKFLEPFHNIFTTNYDLLLYWVEMHALEKLKGRDGFLSAPNDTDAEYVVFQEHIGGRKGIFFIHGALHIFVSNGEVRKHTWARKQKPLIQSIQESLSLGQYPLFVAEGQAEQKLSQIQRSGYLSYCLGKLERIENTLVVFGLSFGDNDSHISDVIAYNSKLKKMYIGIFGDPNSSDNRNIREHADKIKSKRLERHPHSALDIEYFDSSTVPVWRPCDL